MTNGRVEHELGITHQNGVWWYQAPIPRRLHRCQPWTSGQTGGRPVYRCACGGISSDGRRWMERNSRNPATERIGPMTEIPTTQPPKPRRRRHLFRWVFLAIQAIFLIWIITGAVSAAHSTSCAGQVGDALKTCQAAGGIGTTIGVAFIVFFWLAVDVILGVGYLIFRRRS